MMYSRVDTKRDEFLDKAKAARQYRATDKLREHSAIIVQAAVRRYLARCSFKKIVRDQVDQFLLIPNEPEIEYKPTLRPAVEVFHIVRKFLMIFKQSKDKTRFEYLCRYMLLSMNCDVTKNMYISVTMSKDLVHPGISQLKDMLWKCVEFLRVLMPENQRDMKMTVTILHMLVTFTSANNWKFLNNKQSEVLRPGMNKLCENIMGHLHTNGLYPVLQGLLVRGLCSTPPFFKSTTLSAILTVALRPLIVSEMSNNLLTLFIVHILSVPAIVRHTRTMSEESLALMMTQRVFRKSLHLLSNDQSTKIIFNVLEGNYALCLLANLIHLGDCEMEGLVEETDKFTRIVCRLLACCQQYVQGKQSNLTHWHPVLGWFAQKTDQSLHDAMPLVTLQLKLLWSVKFIRLLFEPLFAFTSTCEQLPSDDNNSQSTAAGATGGQSRNFLKKALDRASRQNSTQSMRVKLDSTTVTSTCQSCQVYLTATQTLTQLKMDVMAGLCFQDILLAHLWMLIIHLGPQCGLKTFLDILAARHNNTTHPLFSLLQLACDTAKHIISILDDIEMYEHEQPFPLSMLVSVSSFLNNFVFTVIYQGYIDVDVATTNDVFNSAHSLLITLYDRDCRRSFTPVNHWLIKEAKTGGFLADLEHNKKNVQFLLQTVPHVIPHSQRVILFRRIVHKEKQSLGALESSRVSPQSTLITIHRSRLIEDGYRYLAALQPAALKGVIRVRFINEQGLDEAGIDQDGVFKEFLEETIKRIFNPSLNLFKTTDEHKLYPSPTSYLLDNHLALFEFVGRMLGKAVYEGIVVEVPFASFFLSQLLGHCHANTYSCMDELPSLDPELYKSLTYIKHYKGDVSDLDLTFSYDEDLLGKIVNHELVPGGRVMPVTNENKISYLHLMAHFKMRVQIRDQSSAFIRGFKTIISGDWLEMFSAPELQKLISGDSSDVDLEDLRKHTQYYGGFHSGHRVITWLWDILEKDFTSHERSLFLKFVTSCSKAPLLGFAHLEPPFSIRCVEVSDEQDTGDTVGSVLKGFFNIRRRDPVSRLPTSSTCFNLLKLPNYQKKGTLREKLRYSITSNTGFELS